MPDWDTAFHGIAVYCKPKSVHIRTDYALEAYLALPGNGALDLSDHLHAQYRTHYDTPLDIGRHSLAIEILAHVYVDNIAEALESIADRLSSDMANPVSGLMERVRRHTGVIDCGESSVDNDRFVWDFLSPFHPMIYWVCGQFA